MGMGPVEYSELERRAALIGARDAVSRAETASRVNATLEEMAAEGKAMRLSDEEMALLGAFRRFKVRMRKRRAAFMFYAHRDEGVQLVEETAEIIDPAEMVTGIDPAAA